MACLGCGMTSSVTVCRAQESCLGSSSGSSTRFLRRAVPVVLRRDVKDAGRRSLAIRAATSRVSQSDEYNSAMKRQMRNPYEYHHELGMYYTRISPDLIVGSQPQSRDDIDKLFHDEKVGAILNLQQDKDIEFWGVELPSITSRCEELGVWHIRRPAKDFDWDSLRKELPRAVSALEHSILQGRIVYVHCTAGLGRAPAVAIAYLFWFHNMNLEDAYNMIVSKRPCGPKKDAIRGATYDLAKIDPLKPPFEELPAHAFLDLADWERQLIQDRARRQRWT